MEIEFFTNFAKRINSTLKPSDNVSRETLNVLLKNTDNGILNLNIEVKYVSIPPWNYAWIPSLQRYYHVNERTCITANIYSLSLKCDVLATWGEWVRGQSVYATYSSYDFNPNIDDPRICPVNIIQGVDKKEARIDVFSDSIFDFVSVTGGGGPFNGTAILTGDVVGSIVNDITSTNSNILNGLVKLVTEGDTSIGLANVNPLDFINAIWAVPLNPRACHSMKAFEGIALYGRYYGASDSIQSLEPLHRSTTIEIPDLVYTGFRKSAKYIQLVMYMPYCGIQYIDINDILNDTVLNIDYSAECVGGTFQATVTSPHTGKKLCQFSTSVKMQLPIGFTQNNSRKVLSGTLESIGSVLMQNPTGIGQGVGDMVSGILTPSRQWTSGITESLVSFGMPANDKLSAHLLAVTYKSNVEPSDINVVSGSPCRRVINIDTGYIQASNASVSFGGTEAEVKEFNDMLNGGVYFE